MKSRLNKILALVLFVNCQLSIQPQPTTTRTLMLCRLLWHSSYTISQPMLIP